MPNPPAASPDAPESHDAEADAAQAQDAAASSMDHHQLDELTTRLTDLQRQLEESRQTVTALERRQKIDALLADSDAVDLDAARLLTEVAVGQMDEPDLAAAVEDLQRHKPWLFRSRPPEVSPPERGDSVIGNGGGGATAMGARLDDPDPHHHAAAHAAATGNRRDLMDYLRQRRSSSR